MSRQTQARSASRSSSSYAVVDLLDIDTAKFSFLPPKKNQHGGNYIPIKYDGKPLYVRYESRTCPFGVSTNTQKDTNYVDGERITGYSTSISMLKDYETDPYYMKMREIDNFFIDKCVENSCIWGLGGTKTRPISRDVVEGYDDKGADGKWKRMIKYAYKKNQKTNEREYLDYAPRLEFGIPNGKFEEVVLSDGKVQQSAEFKPGFFDENGEIIKPVNTENMSEVLPNWSKITVLAQWGSVTQGTYGASLKPKIHQVRIFPREELKNDVCLLGGNSGDDEESEMDDLPNMLDDAPVKVEKVEEEVELSEDVEEEEEVNLEDQDGEEIEMVEEEEEEPPKPVAKKTRRVVTKKSSK